MIEKIKKHRILIVLIVLVFVILIFMFCKDRIQEIKANNLESESKRIEYFNENRDNFEYIKDLIINKNVTYIGKNAYNCLDSKYKIQKNIFLCTSNEVENSKEIYEAYISLNMIEVRIDYFNSKPYSITFLFASSWSCGVIYGYCLSNECSSSDITVERENFVSKTNNIDNNWWSNYTYDGEK